MSGTPSVPDDDLENSNYYHHHSRDKENNDGAESGSEYEVSGNLNGVSIPGVSRNKTQPGIPTIHEVDLSTDEDDGDDDEDHHRNEILTYRGTKLTMRTTRKAQLQNDLHELGLAVTGKKKELLDRLREAVRKNNAMSSSPIDRHAVLPTFASSSPSMLQKHRQSKQLSSGRRSEAKQFVPSPKMMASKSAFVYTKSPFKKLGVPSLTEAHVYNPPVSSTSSVGFQFKFDTKKKEKVDEVPAIAEEKSSSNARASSPPRKKNVMMVGKSKQLTFDDRHRNDDVSSSVEEAREAVQSVTSLLQNAASPEHPRDRNGLFGHAEKTKRNEYDFHPTSSSTTTTNSVSSSYLDMMSQSEPRPAENNNGYYPGSIGGSKASRAFKPRLFSSNVVEEYPEDKHQRKNKRIRVDEDMRHVVTPPIYTLPLESGPSSSSYIFGPPPSSSVPRFTIGTRTSRPHSSYRPRPSRLLTGRSRLPSFQKIKAQKTTGIAKEILDTLAQMSTPLEKAQSKPKVTPALAWGKYGNEQKEEEKEKEAASTYASVAPPTSTLPMFGSKSANGAKSSSFMFPVYPENNSSHKSPEPKVHQKVSSPFTSPGFGGSSSSMPYQSSVASFLPSSPEAVDKDIAMIQTPAMHHTNANQQQKKAVSFTVPSKPGNSKSSIHSSSVKNNLKYGFTPPRKSMKTSSTGTSGLNPPNIGDLTYVFSPPPAMGRKAPIKTPKKTPAKPETPAVAAPVTIPSALNFMSTKVPFAAEKNAPTFGAAQASPPPVTVSNVTAPDLLAADNPLAKFMKTDTNSWKCPGCMVRNNNSVLKCPCCETDRPGADAAAASVTSVTPTTTASPLSSSKPAFTFGVQPEPAATPAVKPVAAAPEASTGGFSFNVPVKAKEEKPSTTLPGAPSFSFGAAPAVTEKKDTPSFSFGTTAPAKPSEPASLTDTKPSFTFGQKSPPKSPPKMASFLDTTSGSDSATAASGFSFGSTSTSSTENKKKRSAREDEDTKKPSAPAFSFGGSAGPTSDEPPAKKTHSFTFGATATAPGAPKLESVAEEKAPSFSFGAPEATTKPAEEKKAPSTGFTFGAATSAKTAKEDAAPVTGFSFGGSATDSAFSSSSTSSTKSPPAATPAFSFGASTSTTESKPAFSFGASSATAAPAKTSPPAPAFSFGGSSTLDFSKLGSTTTTPTAASTAGAGFSFGASATPTPAPAFSFGGSKPSASAGAPPATNSAPFAFGNPSGATPAPSSGFSFGGAQTPGNSMSQPFGAQPPPASSSSFSGPAPSPTAGAGFGGAPAFGSTNPTPAVGNHPFSFGARQPSPSASAFPAPAAATNAAPSAFGAQQVASSPGFNSGMMMGAQASQPPNGGFGAGAFNGSTSAPGMMSQMPSSSGSAFSVGQNPGAKTTRRRIVKARRTKRG